MKGWKKRGEELREHGWTAAYGLFIPPLESFLVISQVEMISYIAQQIPPIFPPIPLSAILPFDHVPHFHWIKWERMCVCVRARAFARSPASLGSTLCSCHPVLLPGKETDGRPKTLKNPPNTGALMRPWKTAALVFGCFPLPSSWPSGKMG